MGCGYGVIITLIYISKVVLLHHRPSGGESTFRTHISEMDSAQRKRVASCWALSYYACSYIGCITTPHEPQDTFRGCGAPSHRLWRGWLTADSKAWRELSDAIDLPSREYTHRIGSAAPCCHQVHCSQYCSLKRIQSMQAMDPGAGSSPRAVVRGPSAPSVPCDTGLNACTTTLAVAAKTVPDAPAYGPGLARRRGRPQQRQRLRAV